MIRRMATGVRNCASRPPCALSRCRLLELGHQSWNASRVFGLYAAESMAATKNVSSNRSGRFFDLGFTHALRRVLKTMHVLQRHLSQQCEFIVAQRLRRAYQIWVLYSHLYSDQTVKTMVTKFSKRFAAQQRPLGLLLGTALFNWEKENITDDEMNNCACDLSSVETLLGKKLNHSTAGRLTTAVCQEVHLWEMVINSDNLKVWRKPLDNTYLYEYKVFGTFFDIPARAFFRVQIDTEYRKKWDNLVIKLDVIDRMLLNDQNKSQCEVIHWVMHYPYPMYSRDYVYVRRFMVDEQNKLMVSVCKSTSHPDVPVEKSHVRVNKYRSQLVVRPHEDFDKDGFDYVLTYFDDPQAAFPGPAYSWMTTSGVPDFVSKLHAAAYCLVNGDNLPLKHRKRSRNKQGGWKIF